MDIHYEFIPRNEVSKYISLIKQWDSKKYFTREYDEDLFALFSTSIGCFLDEELIGYGQVQYLPVLSNSSVKINLSCILSPKYRNQGIGTKFLRQILLYCKERFGEEKSVTAEILKKNKASISLVEKNEFDFKYFDSKKIVYEKKLINV